ncbi:phospholipid carrier-dependent glycosyltransferase [Nitrosarchaeum sp.]|uniref:ArnT family glycosyltransferase n=1 Tax=Nitrosarchaeum sp. TaxID=2026886 RepID=UPI00247DC3C5|nr:phospholipid carrier-dependent glycosyltransferase [Nitrosarchaeum sp.]MCV0411885.1 glycosyltransferase family 39 protein [Nitrosarchaeum sp.]
MSKTILDNNSQFYKNPFFVLGLIIISGIVLRLLFFSIKIPVVLDSFDYYMFAMDIKFTHEIPNYSPSKAGWPFFLSGLFSIIPFNETYTFMEIQKLTSVVFSSITAIPIFYLSKLFFPKKYGILAAIIFVFDPRVVSNSSLGSTDPMFVFLIATSLALFLRKNIFLSYIAFFTAGMASSVRPEGLFLFFTLTILYFIKHRKNHSELFKYGFCLLIFLVTIYPFMNYQQNIHGNDLLFNRLENTVAYHIQDPKMTENNSGIPFLIKGLENFPKYLGWILIPNFIIFAPVGFILSFKKLDFNKFSLFLTGIILSTPIFYSYAIPLQDTRYLLPLYPLLSIWTIFLVKKFDKFSKIHLVIPLCVIIILSTIFILIKYDSEYELEVLEITKELNKSPKILNDFYPNSNLLESSDLPNNVEEFKRDFLIQREEGKSIRTSLEHKIKIIPNIDYESIEQLMTYAKQNNLTHLVIEKDSQNSIFNMIYQNESDYSFLEKINNENNLKKYKVKIFEINYNRYESSYNIRN